MRSWVLGLLAFVATTLPAVPAAAHPHLTIARAKALIVRAVGPSTVVSACRPHDHGLLCRYATPASNAQIVETDEPTATWESYAAVVNGRVRFPTSE